MIFGSYTILLTLLLYIVQVMTSDDPEWADETGTPKQCTPPQTSNIAKSVTTLHTIYLNTLCSGFPDYEDAFQVYCSRSEKVRQLQSTGKFMLMDWAALVETHLTPTFCYLRLEESYFPKSNPFWYVPCKEIMLLTTTMSDPNQDKTTCKMSYKCFNKKVCISKVKLQFVYLLFL